METQEEQADQDLRKLIEDGQDALAAFPPYARLVELNKQLRAALGQLIPQVQAHTDTLWRGDTQWDIQQRALDHARHALTGSLGSGLQSAAAHVHNLARHLQYLHSIAQGTEGPGH